MKVIYFVYGWGKAVGGHYVSLRSTAESISKENECVIINLGPARSSSLNSSKLKVYNIGEKCRILDIFREGRRIIEHEKPDVLHAFDRQSYFYANLYSMLYKKPVFLTKCGGPNPKFYPKAQNLILYSKENLDFFESKTRYKRSKKYLLPNRIIKPNQDRLRLEQLSRMINTRPKVFLRISRISNYYISSLIQSIHLVNALNRDGISSILIIIGSIEEPQTYEELSQYINENVILLTDDLYTVNANQLVDIAEYVIGTGRSFMEAASLGKIMLCPLENSDFPLLVTRENFNEVFEKNFSERVSLKDLNTDENYKSIIRALSDNTYSTQLVQDTLYFSEKHFDILRVIGHYQGIYESACYRANLNILDNLILLIGTIYINYRSSRRSNYNSNN